MTNDAPNSSLDLEAAVGRLERMRDEIRKAFLGQDAVLTQVLVALLAGGHVLIEGVPGLGKTLLVRALARSFSGQTARIQFTPDLMPADVVGHVLYEVSTGEMKLRHGPVFTNLLLADEINRAPAKTQAALLEVMQEQQVTLEGRSLPVPRPFMTLATQNPIEQEGTYPLPEAQLDRFLLKIVIDYPNEDEEIALVRHVTDRTVGEHLFTEEVAPVLEAKDVAELQEWSARVRIEPRVAEYAVRLVRASRDWAGVAVGSGPRGALALLRAARANALLAGRDFVIPDDIGDVAVPALRHRLVLTPDVELEGRTCDDVLGALLEHVEAPRE